MEFEMKLVLTLLVRNEEDIIKENILFHLNSGVDFIIVTDNKSVDSTPDILKEFEKDGVLEYIYEPADDYSQWQWVTRMARLATTKYSSDWIINADADEFWYPNEGDLKTILNQVPESINTVQVKRHDFATVNHSEKNFYRGMIYRKTISKNFLGNPLPDKVCHRSSPNVIVKQGNHMVKFSKETNVIKTNMIDILHFPMRSFRQFENKIMNGGAAYERNSELNKAIGDCWRVLYKKYKKNQLAEYYNSVSFDKLEIEKELKSKNLLIDKRLLNFFENFIAIV